MRDVLAIFDAADCGDQAEGDCGAGGGGGENLAGDQCADGGIARSLVRLSRDQAGGDVSSGVFVARSAAEERNVEGFADGDERVGAGGAVSSSQSSATSNWQLAISQKKIPRNARNDKR